MKSLLNALIAWSMGLFIPVLVYLQAVYIVTFADFIIGCTAALLAQEKFSWQKASLLVAKFVCFGFLIMATYQIQEMVKIPPIGIGDLQLNSAVIVAGIICVAELKSILRNIKSAFGIDIYSFLFSKVPFLKNFDTDENGNKDNSTPKMGER